MGMLEELQRGKSNEIERKRKGQKWALTRFAALAGIWSNILTNDPVG